MWNYQRVIILVGAPAWALHLPHTVVESALHSAAQAAARNQDLLSRRRSPIGRARPCRHGEDGAASRYSPRSGWLMKLNMLLRNYLRQMSSEPAIFYRESYKNTNHQANISCTTKTCGFEAWHPLVNFGPCGGAHQTILFQILKLKQYFRSQSSSLLMMSCPSFTCLKHAKEIHANRQKSARKCGFLLALHPSAASMIFIHRWP